MSPAMAFKGAFVRFIAVIPYIYVRHRPIKHCLYSKEFFSCHSLYLNGSVCQVFDDKELFNLYIAVSYIFRIDMNQCSLANIYACALYNIMLDCDVVQMPLFFFCGAFHLIQFPPLVSLMKHVCFDKNPIISECSLVNGFC